MAERGDTRIEAALSDMREARQSHEGWAVYLQHPDVDAAELRPQVEVAGDAAWHRAWVAKYDRVIALLSERSGSPASGGDRG
jgi:hypothetical protein